MRNAQSTLAVGARTDGATMYVRLDGELDITSSPLLQAVVDQTLAGRRLLRLLRQLGLSEMVEGGSVG